MLGIDLIVICFAGFLGAMVDAIVGGGGLVTVPALLAVGLPVHLALGTNKFAASFGTFSSAYEYYKSGNVSFKILKFLLPFSLVGSAIGVLTVLSINPEFLKGLIIFLVIVIGTYTFLKKDLGLVEKKVSNRYKSIFLGTIAALFLGFYDGFFGPGAGSFLIFSLIAIFGLNFKKASANSKWMNLMSNITAMILFVTKGQVLFQVAIPMGIFMILGAKVGANLAIKKGSKFIKPVFIIVSFALVVKMTIDLI